MKIYTVQRQDKFDSESSVSLLNLGCYTDKERAIERARAEYEIMRYEYEANMLKYSDTDTYNPEEYGSGALFIEEDNEYGLYFISYGSEENYESHTTWVDEWEVQE